MEQTSATSGPSAVGPTHITPWQEAIDQLQDALKPDEYDELIGIQSPEDMIKAAQQETKSYQKRRLPRFMSNLQPIIEVVRSFSSAIDMFAQANPSISALVWGSLKFVLELAARSYLLFEKVSRTLTAAYADIPRYNQYAELFPKSERLRSCFVEVLCKLINLNCLLITYLKRHPLKNFLMTGWMPQERDVLRLTADIKFCTKRIEMEANVASMQFQQDALNDLTMLHTHQNLKREGSLPCSMLPYTENHRFFGRESVLEDISKIFDQYRSSGTQCSYVLRGLGGVGKTEIALHFAYTQQNAFKNCAEHRNYDAIFWIRADRLELISQAYVDMARRLGIVDRQNHIDSKESQKAVRDWLETTDCRWLLVFDNACDNDFSVLEENWPSGQNGSILITTRNNEVPHRFSVTASQEINKFDSIEGSEFFLSRFYYDHSDPPLIDAPDQVHDIVSRLDCLPIALSQIAGYMMASRCLLSTFIQLYEDPLNARELHEQNTVGSTSHYRQTIATVWKISISNLNEGALKLLGCLAFLDPEGISTRIPWESAIEHFGFQSAIKSLSKHSLIKYDPEKATISVHRLVQTTSLQSFDLCWKQECFATVQTLLRLIFRNLEHDKTSGLKAMSGDFEMALPHVLSVIGRYHEMEDVLPFPGDLGVLLGPFMQYLFVQGRMRTALSLFPTAEKACQLHLKKDPYALMSLYRICGAIYRNSNLNQEAHQMYLQALDIPLRATESSERYRSLAVVYSSLGCATLALCRVEESLDYHLRGIKIREDHPEIFAEERDREDLALAWINASWAYLEKSDLETAGCVAESSIKVLRGFAKTTEKPTGKISFGLRVLGNVRIAQSRFDDALLMHQEAFRIQIECFGHVHHETGDLCYKMAHHRARWGEKTNAINLLKEALKIYHDAAVEVEVTGAISRTKYYLAVLLEELGNVNEAAAFKKDAASLRKTLVGLEMEEKDHLKAYEALVPYWGR